MPTTNSQSPHSEPAGRWALSGKLSPIPLWLRNLFYGAFFLTVALILLPYLASRLEVIWPRLVVEVGRPLQIVGAAVFVVFLLTYIACSYVLTSRGQGGYVEFDPPSGFVATGPYRWCRNPIAGCVVVMLLGEGLALSSTGILLLFLAAIPLAHLQVTLIEEPLLRQRFGASYDAYLQRVPRWIPRPPREDGP